MVGVLMFYFGKRSLVGSIIVYPHTAAIPAGNHKPNPFLFFQQQLIKQTILLIATPLHQQA
jgi:hypothetical protein